MIATPFHRAPPHAGMGNHEGGREGGRQRKKGGAGAGGGAKEGEARTGTRTSVVLTDPYCTVL